MPSHGQTLSENTYSLKSKHSANKEHKNFDRRTIPLGTEICGGAIFQVHATTSSCNESVDTIFPVSKNSSTCHGDDTEEEKYMALAQCTIHSLNLQGLHFRFSRNKRSGKGRTRYSKLASSRTARFPKNFTGSRKR